MDVLDNILPLMDKGGEKKKVKKEDVKDTSVQSSSFRIPKKPRNTTETAIGQQTSETNNSVSMQTRSEPVPSLSLRDNYRGECKSVSNSGAENKSWDSSINIKRFADTTKRFNFVVPRTIVVEMNGVALDLSNAVEAVDRYHVTITQVRGQKEKDATRGPKNDIAFQHRRRALFSIVRQIMKTHQEHFGSNRYAHIYDLGNTLYSIGCNISAADGEQTYHLNADEISSSFARSFFGGNRLTEMIVTFVHTGKVYLKGPSLYESDGSFREAQKFFEVLSSQVLYEGDYLGYMNKFYEKSQENDKKLGDGKCVKNGFEKNVRILGDNVDNAIPVMQTDTKKSPFFFEQDVLSLIGELFGRDPESALSEKSARKKVASELRNVVVTTTHLDNNRSFFIHGLSEKSSKTEECPYNDEIVTVENYFLLKYKLRLKYPNLPLAVERKASSQSFHPLELLKIERGQRVETKKLSGRLTEKMISECRILPHEMRKHNIEQLSKAKLVSTNNRYLESFKVKTADNFLTSEAKVLSAPEIKYKHDIVRPCNIGPIQNWRVSHFIQPASVRSVSVVIFDQCMQHEDARMFFSGICRVARQRGVQIKNECAQVTDLPSEADELIEQHFKRCRKSNIDIIICLTREKKDSVHDLLKLLETKFLIVTQHIHAQTAMKCSQPRGGIKTIENLLLKFNIKLGGINHSIQIPSQVLARGFNQQDMYNKLFGGRMFVGFELSHASAQSKFDRQFGVAVGEPTVIGIAYTLGTLPTDLGGFYWFQQARLHNIQYLEQQFKRPLEEYHKKCSELPREIIIYRSGASEGEYDEVSSEASMVYRACASCSSLNRGRPYTPKLIIIVAQTKSNYRVIPVDLATSGIPNARAIDLNVPSGTCADKGIVNVKHKEFVMTSQQANIGTSRPTRYTVVVDSEPEIQLEEIEHLTHWLAHAHQASTLPTHVPAILYSAKNLAKRGRANWKAKTMENSDTSSSCSDPRLQLQEGESTDAFYERMSRELNASLPGQFWG